MKRCTHQNIRFPRALIAILALTLLAIGCGDTERGNADTDNTSSDIKGVYETISHTKTDGNCDGPGDPVDESSSSPFFKVVENSFFGQPLYDTYECSTAEKCDENWSIGWPVHIKDGKNWTGTSESSGSGNHPDGYSCSLYYNTFTASPDGDELKLERRTSTLSIVVTNEDDCDTELHTDHKDLACTSLETWIGKRVE